MADVNGRTALVTGASRGIGRAIAVRLAAAGAYMVLHYGSGRADAEHTLDLVRKAGGDGIVVGAGLETLAGIDALAAALPDLLGGRGLDILVNNAGVGAPGTVEDTDEATFDRLFAVDVKAPFFVTQRILPQVNDGGRIINISSMVALAAHPYAAAYSAAKGALNAMTVSIAAGLGARGITVNAVAPGATATDFIGALLDDPAIRSDLEQKSVFGRIGQPEDIAGVVAFLASPEAGWVTGQVIAASGGAYL